MTCWMFGKFFSETEYSITAYGCLVWTNVPFISTMMLSRQISWFLGYKQGKNWMNEKYTKLQKKSALHNAKLKGATDISYDNQDFLQKYFNERNG